ncbi:unnamed protein product [Darwinula stevensoni]|uniref:NUDE domain-containing protein n=1 Tax=Darwinula stevensoni TaxID=69355 RepID=A0A7R8X9Z7_9CRUS|nr:unnamed protein product [Darwinula stevensoni]CAG0889698.1 unnamed protein product [Darwinula stevensoni]
MENIEVPEFRSMDEEVRFWREKALQYKACMEEVREALEETREEFEEFQEGSRALEAELEAQLKQGEDNAKELRTRCNTLKLDNDIIREQLEVMSRDMGRLQDELSAVSAIRDQLHQSKRDLETENDDLERAKRTIAASLTEFERKLNEALERNAYLESELDEKEHLKENVQRLKDEVRDLRSELQIKQQEIQNDIESMPKEKEPTKREAGEGAPTKPDRPQSLLSPSKPESPSSNSFHTPKGALANGNANGLLTPSARISALNIVGDLLRKVGALESRLASCRNYVKDTPQTKTANNRAETPRGKQRLPRGTSVPNVQNMILA